MTNRTRDLVTVGIIVAALSLAIPGCAKRGPAQRAGEKIDRAADKISDTLDPKGPAEKAGRKLDRALDR